MTVVKLLAYLAWTRKTLVSLASALAVILSTGLLHGTVQAWVTTAAAVLGTVLVYWVANADPPKPELPAVTPGPPPK